MADRNGREDTDEGGHHSYNPQMTLIEFAGDIQALAERLKKNVGEVLKQVATTIDEDIRDHTPVDTGTARDSWYMTVGAPSTAFTPAGNLPHGAAVAPHPIENIQPNADDTVYITNNAPYIEVLEQGSSKQAPSGMAELAVEAAEWRIQRTEWDLFK
jgi:hypothetical protein